MKSYTLTIGYGMTANNQPIAVDDANHDLRYIQHMLAMTFDGYTMTRGYGGWMDDGHLIEEPVAIFQVVTDLPPTMIVNAGKRGARKLQQQCFVFGHADNAVIIPAKRETDAQILKQI